MGQLGAALGTPLPFVFEGQTYHVHPRDLGVEGEFGSWLEGRAVDFIERHAPSPDGQELPGRFAAVAYFQQHEGLRRDSAAGYYDYDGPVAAVMLAQQDGPGKKHLAYLQLARLNPSITPALVSRVWKDPVAKASLLGILARLDQDPNPSPAAEESTTPTSTAG